jgi:hypothetical protein
MADVARQKADVFHLLDVQNLVLKLGKLGVEKVDLGAGLFDFLHKERETGQNVAGRIAGTLGPVGDALDSQIADPLADRLLGKCPPHRHGLVVRGDVARGVGKKNKLTVQDDQRTDRKDARFAGGIGTDRGELGAGVRIGVVRERSGERRGITEQRLPPVQDGLFQQFAPPDFGGQTDLECFPKRHARSLGPLRKLVESVKVASSACSGCRNEVLSDELDVQ